MDRGNFSITLGQVLDLYNCIQVLEALRKNAPLSVRTIAMRTFCVLGVVYVLGRFGGWAAG